MKSKLPDFSGKLLSIHASCEDCPCLVGDAHFEMLAGRLFLVGIVPAGGSTGDWVAGLRCTFAWDNVQDYIIFDSAEDYAKRIKMYDKAKKKRKA
jgi:hypothetical protein